MARTKPELLIQIVEDGTTWQVVRGKGIFAVVYNGHNFNLLKHRDAKIVGKYVQTTFVNRGNADRLARKLNAVFGTDQFTVSER